MIGVPPHINTYKCTCTTTTAQVSLTSSFCYRHPSERTSMVRSHLGSTPPCPRRLLELFYQVVRHESLQRRKVGGQEPLGIQPLCHEHSSLNQRITACLHHQVCLHPSDGLDDEVYDACHEHIRESVDLYRSISAYSYLASHQVYQWPPRLQAGLQSSSSGAGSRPSCSHQECWLSSPNYEPWKSVLLIWYCTALGFCLCVDRHSPKQR